MTNHVPGVWTARLAPAWVLLGAFGLGVASGGRSTVGPAALVATRAVSDRSAGRPLSLLASPRAPLLAGTAVVGELVADKLPSTPSRLRPPVLGGRLLSGALAGWALAQRHRAPVALPAVLGAAGAFAGSVAGARWRRAATGKGLPDVTAALLEDAATLVLGWTSAQSRPAG